MSLERYKRKRDFGKTPEPSGEETPAPAGRGARAGAGRADVQDGHAAGGRFVVQRHRARNLHYDFRLEIGGVLVSWAIPKGPTLDPAVKRGAFHVEDHPLDYYDFEGTIPRGQYGAGDVIVWDWGRFEPELADDPGRSVAGGELKFELFGEKLRGRFTIVRTRGGGGRPGAAAHGTHAAAATSTSAGGPEREEWLLIKKRDAAAVPGWEIDALPRSVKTGRTNDQVAAGIEAAEPAVPPVASVAELAGARPAPMPAFVEPMKATLIDRPFSDPAWLFELKWDGYRVQAHIRDGRVSLFTRGGQNGAAYFPELAGPPDWLAAREAIVDGEVVALNPAGEPDFHLLQAWGAGRAGAGRASSARTSSAGSGPASLEPDRERGTLAYQVFDLLYLDGHSLLDVPLEERKSLLRSVVREVGAVRYAGHVEGDGEAFYAAVAERGLEGIVAKLRRSRYEPGRRSGSWLKIKRRSEQEFVIGGWTPRIGADADLGALVIGAYEGGSLRPAGKVGTGFDAAERARLMTLMAPLARSTAPFRPAPGEKLARWVEPRLVARVEFAEWPAGGALRAPVYKGLDLDVDPAGVVREAAGSSPRVGAVAGEPPTPRVGAVAGEPPTPPRGQDADPPGPAARETTPTVATPAEMEALDALPGSGGRWSVAGRELRLSNLDKPIWPDDAIVKRDLIRYYTFVAPYALPYLRDRALTVMRHPNGIDRPGFWQKQLPRHAPAWIERWSRESVAAGETRDYAVAEEVATLAWLANEAAIDLHPSTFRLGAPERPTWALIDIDPGPRTGWDDVLLLARLYRTALEHLGVVGFPKVTGQRGIQVWIPIKPVYTFDQTRDWVGGVSRAVGAAVPDLVSWEWSKTSRGGLARLDYTQNAWNKTLVAPYAVRPVAGAAVSAPIAWDELDDPALRPNGWTIRSMPERLARAGDLFAPSLELEQELPSL